MEIYVRFEESTHLLTTLSAKELRKGHLEQFMQPLRTWGMRHPRRPDSKLNIVGGHFEVNRGKTFFIIETEES